MSDNGRARRSVGLVAALVVVIGAFGSSMASGQTTGDTYTGCLRDSGKIVKVAIGDAPAEPCVAPAIEVRWGETGPEGPPGAKGEIGPQGIRGPRGQQGIQGVPGVSGY